MTIPAEHAGSPAELAARLTSSRAVRGASTGVAAIFTAIGWAAGRMCVFIAAVFLAIGWLAGLCFSAVIFGFQVGAKIAPPAPSPPPAPEDTR